MHRNQTGVRHAKSLEWNYANRQCHPGGSTTTGDDGELICADTNGNGFSSGG